MQNLKALREMSEAGKPKHMVHVYRGGRWSVIKCEELLPGDITSVARSKEPIIAPCTFLPSSPARPPARAHASYADRAVLLAGDMVLLSGSCVVDEAMLTGESTPQLKVLSTTPA
jgi:cation-transporting ATPase 13A1